MLAPQRTRRARMWVYLGDEDHPYNIFDFTLSRSRDGPATFLKNYNQVLLADAYGGYEGICVEKQIIQAGCWAHYPEYSFIRSRDAVSHRDAGFSWRKPSSHVRIMFWSLTKFELMRLWCHDRAHPSHCPTAACSRGDPRLAGQSDWPRLPFAAICSGCDPSTRTASGAGASPIDQLREEIVRCWAARYIRRRRTDPCRTKRSIHSALWAWSWGLQACGYEVPPWNVPAVRAPSRSPWLEAFAAYRREVRGAAESAVRRDLAIVQQFIDFLHRHGRKIPRIQVQDVDEFLHERSRLLALTTLARIAYALRAFLRFLYASGRLPHDLADAVSTPRIRRGNRPPRALPWADVRRILKAVDKEARSGCVIMRCCW